MVLHSNLRTSEVHSAGEDFLISKLIYPLFYLQSIFDSPGVLCLRVMGILRCVNENTHILPEESILESGVKILCEITTN